MKPLSTVAIVGVGLIGGSIGMALRQRKLAERVIGIGRRQESLRAARRVGAVDHTTVDMEKGVAEAELVIVCTPVGRIVEDVRKAAMHCPEGTLITDAGSTKQTIVADLDQGLPRGCRFLGSHPLAGSEKTGAAFARADLFEGRIAILTPTKNTRAEDFDFLEDFWAGPGFGCRAAFARRARSSIGALPAICRISSPRRWFLRSRKNISAWPDPGMHDTTRIASGDAEIVGADIRT